MTVMKNLYCLRFLYYKKTKEMPMAIQPNQALFSFTIILIR